MPFVPQAAIDVFSRTQDNTPNDVVKAKIVNAVGEPCSARTARRWRRYFELGVADPASPVPGSEVEVTEGEIEAIYKLIRTKSMSVHELSEALDRSESSISHILAKMEDKGYNIAQDSFDVQITSSRSVRPPDEIPAPIAHSMELKLAFPSDWHFGSKMAQITHFLRFIAHARESGVKDFFVPGDIFHGTRMYRGQELDLYAKTPDAQEEALSYVFKPEPDEHWYILGGNHDWSLVKNCGTDKVWHFCQKWPNVYFLGYDKADIPVTDQFSVRLLHPGGGPAYAASYRAQKSLEALAYEELSAFAAGEKDPCVRVLAVGHLHFEFNMMRGHCVAFQAGCFEAQTAYEAQKNLIPNIGAYILTLRLSDSGNIVNRIMEFPQYSAIKDDYLNYPIPGEIKEADPVEIRYSSK